MTTRDHVSILEAAYVEAGDDADWEERLLESLSTIDEGLGVVVGGFERLPDGHARRNTSFRGTSAPELLARFEGMVDGMPPGDVSVCFSFVNSGKTGSSVGVGNFAAYDAIMRPLGAGDCLGVFGLVDWKTTYGVYVPLRERRGETPGRSRRLQRLGAHLGAARRARSAHRDEAILEAGGRVAHLEGEAIAERETLRDRVCAIDRARTAAGRADLEAALDAWTALCDGRWSLLDRFDSDGRRYVVARRNHPGLGRPLALSPREEQVVKLHAMGQSSKYVAYTLGLSPATVSAHLRTGMRKLGLASKADLVALWTAVHPEWDA